MPVPGYTPEYSTTSPWSFSQIRNNYLSYYVHRPVNPHATDRFMPRLTDQRYVHRPDLLAQDFYGDPDLYWIIPIRNRLQDPIFDLKIGVPLYIPDPIQVRTII